MVIKIVKCPHCESVNLWKIGFAPNGKQRYRGKDCRRHSRDNAKGRKHPPEWVEQVLKVHRERMSLRAIHRTFGVAPKTVIAWLKKVLSLPRFEATLLPSQDDDVMELDEVWSFWGDKRYGACWLWIALCRRTRQVVGFALGDRGDQTCQKLYRCIPAAYQGCSTVSDWWESYAKVFARNRCVGKESGETAHVERWNNTLRQRLSRYVRKTLSFSKSLKMHFIALVIFIWE